MKKSVRFGAPNLMFFVEDKSGGISPVIDDSNVLINPRFWATSTTLIIGSLHRDDGDIDLTVSTSEKDALETLPRFDAISERRVDGCSSVPQNESWSWNAKLPLIKREFAYGRTILNIRIAYWFFWTDERE